MLNETFSVIFKHREICNEIIWILAPFLTGCGATNDSQRSGRWAMSRNGSGRWFGMWMRLQNLRRGLLIYSGIDFWFIGKLPMCFSRDDSCNHRSPFISGKKRFCLQFTFKCLDFWGFTEIFSRSNSQSLFFANFGHLKFLSVNKLRYVMLLSLHCDNDVPWFLDKRPCEYS